MSKRRRGGWLACMSRGGGRSQGATQCPAVEACSAAGKYGDHDRTHCLTTNRINFAKLVCTPLCLTILNWDQLYLLVRTPLCLTIMVKNMKEDIVLDDFVRFP